MQCFYQSLSHAVTSAHHISAIHNKLSEDREKRASGGESLSDPVSPSVFPGLSDLSLWGSDTNSYKAAIIEKEVSEKDADGIQKVRNLGELALGERELFFIFLPADTLFSCIKLKAKVTTVHHQADVITQKCQTEWTQKWTIFKVTA